MRTILKMGIIGTTSLMLLTSVQAATKAVDEVSPPGNAVPPEISQACLTPKVPDRLSPRDYRTVDDHWRNLVENEHFDAHYKAYLEGYLKVPAGRHKEYESISAGFDYTLWGFPNHPRALAAIERLSHNQKNVDKLPGMHLSVSCYFQRAVQWYPDDPLPHAIYAYYLARRQHPEQARYEVWQADRLEAYDFNVSMYLAFALIEMHQYQDAARHAKRAYAQGYPLPWLRQRLAREGVSLD